MTLFAGPCDFFWGAASADQLPPAEKSEVAFAGRSNVGKSSLINALTNRKNLARASNTPGRTQELNFFDLAAGRAFLVDLPGYGFAEAPKSHVEAWNRLMLDYLRHRANLKRVFLLIDARRGIGPVDRDVLDLLDKSAVNYQVVLTKADKIRKMELAPTIDDALAVLKKRPAAHPRVMATSSEKGLGLEELRAEINALASQR